MVFAGGAFRGCGGAGRGRLTECFGTELQEQQCMGAGLCGDSCRTPPPCTAAMGGCAWRGAVPGGGGCAWRGLRLAGEGAPGVGLCLGGCAAATGAVSGVRLVYGGDGGREGAAECGRLQLLSRVVCPVDFAVASGGRLHPVINCIATYYRESRGTPACRSLTFSLG